MIKINICRLSISSRFPSFIFRIVGEVQFFNSSLHQGVVDENTVQQANDSCCC
jgi:hypothetical protein